MPTPATPADVVPPESPGRIEVEFLDAPFTPDVWNTWEATTRSYGCTREFVEYFENPAGASLALVRAEPAGDALAAFLFTRGDRGAARVLGRFYAPAAEHLGAFVEALFARHPDLDRVQFGVIDALPDLSAIARPVIAPWEGVEMRISLPRSVDEYERTLDRDFLKRMRSCARKLARECPSARFSTLERAAIPRSWVADVVHLNRERAASKNGRSVLNERYEEGIFKVARAHGAVTALLDGERICAGAINIRCGTETFGWVNAYDEAYGRFRAGYLCSMASIHHAIAGGGGTLHLLHGHSPYKRDFGGRRAPIATYVVLRSWAAVRPEDGARLLRKHSERLARKAIDLADPIAARALGRRAPIELFVHALAERLRAVRARP